MHRGMGLFPGEKAVRCREPHMASERGGCLSFLIVLLLEPARSMQGAADPRQPLVSRVLGSVPPIFNPISTPFEITAAKWGFQMLCCMFLTNENTLCSHVTPLHSADPSQVSPQASFFFRVKVSWRGPLTSGYSR